MPIPNRRDPADCAPKHHLQQSRGLSHRVAGHAHRWTLCLRALATEIDHVSPEDVATQLFPQTSDADSALSTLLAEGKLLRGDSYRRVLLLKS